MFYIFNFIFYLFIPLASIPLTTTVAYAPLLNSSIRMSCPSLCQCHREIIQNIIIDFCLDISDASGMSSNTLKIKIGILSLTIAFPTFSIIIPPFNTQNCYWPLVILICDCHYSTKWPVVNIVYKNLWLLVIFYWQTD